MTNPTQWETPLPNGRALQELEKNKYPICRRVYWFNIIYYHNRQFVGAPKTSRDKSLLNEIFIKQNNMKIIGRWKVTLK